MEPSWVNIQSINPAARASLPLGTIVSLRVVESQPGGRFTLLWNSRRISASSRLKLNIGQIIRARVEGSRSALRLRLLPIPGAPESLKVPRSAVPSLRSILSSSLLRAGSALPGEAEAERRLALLSRTRGRPQAAARLYAELLTRGADPTADFLEALYRRLFGSFGDLTGDSKSKPRSWDGLPSADTLAEEFGRREDADPLLELLGNIQGNSGSWRFKRLRRRINGRTAELILKFRRGSPPAMALTVHQGGRTFEFLLKGSRPMQLRVFSDHPDSVNQQDWKEFRDSPALTAVDVHDVILPIEQSDGFTIGALQAAEEMEERFIERP